MHDDPGAVAPISSLDKVRAALAALGSATPTMIAAHTALGYSTVPKKLRTLQGNGHAETVNVDGQTQWRLTAAGRAYHGEAASTLAAHADTPDNAVTPDDAVTPDAVTAAEDAPAEPAPTAAAPLPAGAAGVEPHTTPPTAISTPSPHDTDVDDHEVGDTGTDTTTEPHDDTTAPDRKLSPVTASDSTDAPTDADTVTAAAPAIGDEPTGEGTRRSPAKGRRAKGAMRQEILDLLLAHRGTALSTGEICKLIDQANEGKDVNKASAGAVANALEKLVGSAVTVTQPAKGSARYEAVTASETA